MASSNEVTFKSKELFTNAFRTLEYMRQKKKMCDLTIIARGVKISAHKIVLVSRCQYFYNYFTMESNSNQVIVELDFDPELLTIAIDYMYTNQLTIPLRYLEDFMELLETLLLNDLEQECFDEFPNIINNMNCMLLKKKTYSATKSCTKKILVTIGGCTDTPYDTLEYYAFQTGRWSQTIIPFEAMGAASVGVGDKVYLFGSTYSDDRIRKYCLSTNMWHEVGRMTKPRVGHSVAELDGFVYIFGGYGDHTAEKYDLKTKLSTIIAPMPFTDRASGVAVLNEKIYVVAHPSVGCYDTNTNKWTMLIDIMEERRSFAAICALNGKLYIAGGFSNAGGCLNTVRIYEPEKHIWTYVKPMKFARVDPQAAVIDDKMYIVGGFDLKSTELYDENTDSWTLLPEMNVARWSHTIAVINIEHTEYL